MFEALAFWPTFVDPVFPELTLSIGPLAVAALLSAGTGLAQAAANAAPDSLSRRNRARVRELQALEEGDGFGLQGADAERLTRRLLDPVAASANALQRQNERIQAATGGLAAADVNALQRQTAATQAQASLAAADQLAQANQLAAQRQQNELERRLALQAARRRDVMNQAFGAATDLAGPLGEALELESRRNVVPDPTQLAEFAETQQAAVAPQLAQVGAGVLASGAGAALGAPLLSQGAAAELATLAQNPDALQAQADRLGVTPDELLMILE